MSLTARVLRRLADEMRQRHLTQADIGEAIGMTQSAVSKWFKRRVEIRVDDLEPLAQAVGLSVVELVRDPTMEFMAELAPTELRILERIRQRPHVRDALLVLLEMTPPKPPASPKSRSFVGRGRTRASSDDKELQNASPAAFNSDNNPPRLR